ncbi:50S ribosomal protein L25/general stress protein Ctc [Azospira restricta]|uniref:Large ribosomal subunit protein bL25 n=1 Tax=Azospira restricta TaxID=404405 RepID=A0A974SPC5_9RHOO|nr:50S ribosomal protein L25/general stress protein Ctc [Azospira restricta]QRJ64013.1 50S ribosomal protein L25/general stress protein Ctc [Azospira restricta]
MQFELTAKKRTDQGSGASRRLRRAGRVPAVVYGGNEAAQAIELDHNTILLNLRKEAFHASVLTLDIEGKKEPVLLRDNQMHPYKAIVLHVDFQRVDPNQKLHQKVPLHFVNADVAPGVKLSGGLVSHTINELDVTCLPANLPEFIEVDLKDLKVGQSIHVKDLTLPKGVSVVTHGQDTNPVVVSIVAKKGGSDEAAEAPAA